MRPFQRDEACMLMIRSTRSHVPTGHTKVCGRRMLVGQDAFGCFQIKIEIFICGMRHTCGLTREPANVDDLDVSAVDAIISCVKVGRYQRSVGEMKTASEVRKAEEGL